MVELGCSRPKLSQANDVWLFWSQESQQLAVPDHRFEVFYRCTFKDRFEPSFATASVVVSETWGIVDCETLPLTLSLQLVCASRILSKPSCACFLSVWSCIDQSHPKPFLTNLSLFRGCNATVSQCCIKSNCAVHVFVLSMKWIDTTCNRLNNITIIMYIYIYIPYNLNLSIYIQQIIYTNTSSSIFSSTLHRSVHSFCYLLTLALPGVPLMSMGFLRPGTCRDPDTRVLCFFFSAGVSWSDGYRQIATCRLSFCSIL